MPLKLVEVDGKQYAEIQDGKPVWVESDGKETAFDIEGTRTTITRLNGEAKSHRERAEAAEATVKTFEGIADPKAAIKALETVANLDAKKLIDAGEVERVKTEIKAAFQTQLDDATGKVKAYEDQLYAEKIGGAFARSKLIADKFAIPADLVQARFGQAFKVEEGKTVAYDANGNKIFSRARPGELADFDEALEVLVDAYPYKEQILKSSGANGGGANGGKGGPPASAKGNFGGTSEERKAAINSKFDMSAL